MNINFREFDKEDLVSALELMLSLNLLPSLEVYLIEIMNKQRFNRINDKRKELITEIRKLIDCKQTMKVELQINQLMRKLELIDKTIEKRLIHMLENKIITQDEYQHVKKGKE